jgi:hypothetical protein
MKDCEAGSFANCARGTCIIFGLKNLHTEAVQLASTIKRNFEELVV